MHQPYKLRPRYISYAADMHVTWVVLQTEVLFNSKGVTHDHPF